MAETRSSAVDTGSQVRPEVRLESVTKRFRREDGAEVLAIDDLSLDVEKGEFLVLLGPSGCGKTTLLRSIAGLEQPDGGRVEISGTPVYDAESGLAVPPEKRRLSMIFQSYALWPHMTVRQNVGYPLRMRGISRAETRDKVDHTLEMMRVSDVAAQRPGQISGGQQQRVALARAIVAGDDVVLFDEPLSNVDAKVRDHLRLELLAMQRELGFTAVYVTHDQDEAMALATQIAVLEEGRIAQLGPPRSVYNYPESAYVGRFIGSANELRGELRREGNEVTVDTRLGQLHPLPDRVRAKGADVIVLSRPERWQVGLEPHDDLPWRGIVRAAAFIGSHNEYLIELDGLEIQVWELGRELIEAGTTVWCSVRPSDLMVVDGREVPA